MTITYIIEGPKGSGKSTLCKNLALDFGAQIEIFSDKNSPHLDKMTLDSNDLENHIHDRSYLSYLVYGWSQDAHQAFEISQTSTNLILSSWSPLTKKDFLQMIKLIDRKLIILYASDPQDLVNRIEKRRASQGKGATQSELGTLHLSNAMFKSYIHILKTACDLESKMLADKILAIDISKGYTEEEMVNMAKEA